MRIATIVLAAGIFAMPAFAKQPRQQQKILLPVNAPCVSSPFGPRVIEHRPDAGTFHSGIDLPAPEGAPVRAVAAGTIMRVQNTKLGGQEILIQHNGYVGIYSHLKNISEDIKNRTDLTVAAGEQIAEVGLTGLTFGPHLYFAMIKGNEAVDPQPIFGLKLCDGVKQVETTAGNTPRAFFARDAILPVWNQQKMVKDGKLQTIVVMSRNKH
jgi:murein DD-endopeptidase MepM/ murein hydrolase activator NlpD